MLDGMPIIVTTRTFQCGKHRKYRINKKWRKKYGVKEVEVQPKGKMMVMDGKIYMTLSDFNKLKEQMGGNT